MFNIIPQNYRIMLEEILRKESSNFTSHLCDSIINNIFNSDANNKYLSLINEINENSMLHIKNIMIKMFETLDFSYKKSFARKQRYYINKSNVPRTIITIFGEISFKRTYYINKFSNDKYFYLDQLIGLVKYDHYDPIVKAKAIYLTCKTNQAEGGRITGESISSLLDVCKNNVLTHIPRQSVYNWISKWNTPSIKYDAALNTPSTLYVMADEKYIGSQDLDNDIMIKSCVIFEGVKKVGKNRNALINKLVISANTKTPWITFTDIINQRYDMSKIKHIYLMGDGASWIKSGISELKLNPNIEVKFLLCKFHFIQYIHHITTDKDLREVLINMVLNGKKSDLINKFNEIIAGDPKRKEQLTKKTNYILNNFNSIKAMNNSNIGSSMESHISHYIASTFASRPKGYSSLNIKKYLMINDYKNNGINIMDLYLQSYQNTEVITLNQKEIDYSIFDKKGSNIPIINYGKNTNTYKLLSRISSVL
ncbi:MAG: UPF0236 family protein [Bacilli bacterium]